MIQDTSLHYTIYVDRLFMDYMTVYCLLMLLVGQLIRRKLRPMRLLLCASIWSITGILCLLFPAWIRRGGSIAIESLMGGLLFCLLYGKPQKRILAGVLMVNLLSVMYLTGCFEIAYRFEKWTGIRGSRLLLAGILAALFIVWLLRRSGKNLYRVRLSYGGKECEVTAFVDTGNFLKEPVSQKPVCIVQQNSVPWNLLEDMEGIYMIPYHAIGTDAGLLPAIKVKHVEVEDRESIYVIPEMILAVYRGEFSVQGKYQMLLHPEYMKERKELCWK